MVVRWCGQVTFPLLWFRHSRPGSHPALPNRRVRVMAKPKKLTPELLKLIWFDLDRGVPEQDIMDARGVSRGAIRRVQKAKSWREFYPKREPQAINPNRI